jgi:pimeloyl-ACP methyl ester carboxylesterase
VKTTPVYGVVGSGPVVVVLAEDLEHTLYGTITDGLVPALLSSGFQVVSLDLPCHGADATPADGSPLDCWALRIAAGDDYIFLTFCAGLSNVLDAMHVTSAAIVGISRGGYVAVTCAAYEPRFRDIVMEIPVTDLNYLDEFKNYPVDETRFNLQQYIPYIEDREKLLSIDKVDTRVGTNLAIAFAEASGSQLILTANGDHVLTPVDGMQAAEWLQQHPF